MQVCQPPTQHQQHKSRAEDFLIGYHTLILRKTQDRLKRRILPQLMPQVIYSATLALQTRQKKQIHCSYPKRSSPLHQQTCLVNWQSKMLKRIRYVPKNLLDQLQQAKACLIGSHLPTKPKFLEAHRHRIHQKLRLKKKLPQIQNLCSVVSHLSIKLHRALNQAPLRNQPPTSLHQ